ncbi:MAG: hypothetical protein K2X87_08045 [Gemmataceae bacterium]|nr:hypothetical protein [Gemmataceae bacterium]
MTAPSVDPVSPRSLALCRRAELLLDRMEQVDPPDMDVLRALAEERGWVDAVRFFALKGTLTPEGLADAEESLAETEGWVAEQLAAEDADEEEPPTLPAVDRGPFENHAEPVVSFQAMFMANAWYQLSPQPDGPVGIRYGAWCQGIGTLNHDGWTAHEDRETAIRHFVADVRELLKPVKQEPVQEKARDELLQSVEALLTRPS